MKRWLCLAAALMLTPVLASAQMVSISELYDQAQTLGRWKASYEAHGRTIDVDIPIIVPEVEYCPVLTVNAVQPFSDEQMEEIKDRFSFRKQEGRYVIQGEEAGFEERAGDIVKLSFTPKAGSSDFIKERARVSVSCNDHLRKINEEMLMMGKVKSGAYYWGWEMERDTAYAEDNPMTTGRAIGVVDRVLDRVYPEIEVCSVVNAAIVNNRLRERKTENVLMESPIGSYSFQLLQTIYGVPIGMGASNFLSLKDGSYISTGMNATVLSDYVYSVAAVKVRLIQCQVKPAAVQARSHFLVIRRRRSHRFRRLRRSHRHRFIVDRSRLLQLFEARCALFVRAVARRLSKYSQPCGNGRPRQRQHKSQREDHRYG